MRNALLSIGLILIAAFALMACTIQVEVVKSEAEKCRERPGYSWLSEEWGYDPPRCEYMGN